jgi:hypothetical protein
MSEERVDYDSSSSDSGILGQETEGGGNPRMVIMDLAAPHLEHEHTAVIIPLDGSQPEVEGTQDLLSSGRWGRGCYC